MKMKGRLTLSNLLFLMFALITIFLGVRQFLDNQDKITAWDLDQAERLKKADRILEELEENASRRRFDPTF
jgi:hypothetical protein